MNTAYKTRAWWMLRALEYAEGCYGGVNDCGDYTRVDPRQITIWEAEAVKCGRAAVAPTGDPKLTRIYVDRKGDLLAA